MCGAAACSRFPGPGTYASRCFSAVPRRPKGAAGPFPFRKGGRQGGCPPSPIPGGAAGGSPPPVPPEGEAASFPMGKGAAAGVPPSCAPRQGGAFSVSGGWIAAGICCGGRGFTAPLSRRLPPFGAAGGAAELPRPKSTGFPGSEYSPRPGRPCWAAPRRWCWYR